MARPRMNRLPKLARGTASADGKRAPLGPKTPFRLLSIPHAEVAVVQFDERVKVRDEWMHDRAIVHRVPAQAHGEGGGDVLALHRTVVQSEAKTNAKRHRFLGG